VARAKMLAEQEEMEMAQRQRQQEMMAHQQANEAIMTGLMNCTDRWEVDAYGNRTFHPGFIR
jgi:hypothetical protein